MFSHIIRYDWILLRANRTLVFSIGLLAFFVGFALWSGYRQMRFQRETLTAIQRADTEAMAQLKKDVQAIESGIPWAGSSWQNPSSPYTIGSNKGAKYTTLPPDPLAIFAVGQSDLRAYYYRVTMTRPQSLYHSEEIENAATLYNGNFDLVFAIVYLLPLLVVALSYNVVSSEKEQGTLALLLSSEADFRQIIFSKYVFRWLLLNGVFVGLVTAGILLAVADLSGSVGRLLLVFLLVLLYTAFWFALSFAVNSYGKNSGYNAAVLVGAWLVFVLIVPTVLSVGVSLLHPVPSRVELVTRTRETSDAVKKKSAKLLSSYYEDHPELVPKGQPVDYDDFALQYLRTQMAVEEAMKPTEAQFEKQLHSQQMLVSYYRFLSPTVFVSQSLNDVTRTGDRRYTDFKQQTLRFYRSFQQFFVQKVFRQEKMSSTEFDRIPGFQYQPPDTAFFTIPNVLNLFFLIIATGFCIAIGLVKTRKAHLAAV